MTVPASPAIGTKHTTKPSRDFTPGVFRTPTGVVHPHMPLLGASNHPSNISTLLFAFATLIVHTLFRTSPGQDKNLNLTSSYLDLSVLYGCNDKEMDSVRRKDGTGRIWEDTWADPRLLTMVPAVGALMVVFSRNHNVSTLSILSSIILYLPSDHHPHHPVCRHQAPRNKRKPDLRASPIPQLPPSTTRNPHPGRPV